jgi:hypothetical protein
LFDFVWWAFHVPIAANPYVKSYNQEIFIPLFDDISGPFFGGGGGGVKVFLSTALPLSKIVKMEIQSNLCTSSTR